MKAYPELVEALRAMLDRMDESLRATGYRDDSIAMYIAGGIAVNYWCGSRYTADVDASFSRRIILPKDLTISYRKKDGAESFIYFDHNYNTSFALLHERSEDDSIEWQGMGNERRLVRARVLSPIDLAVSKISRFSEQDQEDIVALARETRFTPEQLRQRANEALANYVGDMRTVRQSIDLICRRIVE
jgi:hypothetical protein